jgi:hypothetical protein
MPCWPKFVVTIEARAPRAVPGMAPPPAPVLRLRRWLKLGLRLFGLVALEVRELPGTSPTPTQGEQ